VAVQASFKEGLGGINAWYGHPLTTVLLVDSDLPEGSHTNRQPYKDRGWCRMEMRASSMVKHVNCLISAAKLSGEEVSWGQVASKSKGNREQGEPPTAPPAFTAELEGGVASGEVKFTNKGDVSLVTGIYDEAFVSQMERTTRLFYVSLGWDDAQGAALIEALRYAHAKGGLRKLKMLCLDGNRLGATPSSRRWSPFSTRAAWPAWRSSASTATPSRSWACRRSRPPSRAGGCRRARRSPSPAIQAATRPCRRRSRSA